MRDKVRKHFYFSGDVQMVGFRYQAKYAADDHRHRSKAYAAAAR